MSDKRQIRNRKRELPEEIANYVQSGVADNKPPTQIFDELMAKYTFNQWNKKFPGYPIVDKKTGHILRTIQRMCADLKAKDSSAVWQLQNEDFTPHDARCVLAVLQCVIRRTLGRKRTLTNNEARWIVRTGQTAPSLYQPGKLWLLWVLAQLYLLHESKEKPTDGLDAYMAFEPWIDARRWAKYNEAVKEKFVLPVPLAAVLVGDGPYLDLLDDRTAGYMEESIQPLVERVWQLQQRKYSEEEIVEILDKEKKGAQ